MNRTTKIFSIVLIIIFVGIIILSLFANIWFGEELDDQKQQRAFSTWRTFKSDQFDFTFRYPPEAIVDISDPAVADEPKRVRVRFIGPESKPNTEITDGFTFNVRVDSLNKDEELPEAVNRIFQAESRHQIISHDLINSHIKDQDAYSFSIQSELGAEVIYTIFKKGEDTIFITSSTVSVPNGAPRNYSEMIEQMQASLSAS